MSKTNLEKQSLLNKQQQPPPPIIQQFPQAPPAVQAYKHKLKKVEGCGGFSHFSETSSCPTELTQVLPIVEYKNLVHGLNKEIRAFRLRNAIANLLALPIIFAAILLTFYKMYLTTTEFAIIIVSVFVLLVAFAIFNLYWNKKKIARIAGIFNAKYKKQFIELTVTRHQKFRRNYKFKAVILYSNILQNQRIIEQQLNNYQQSQQPQPPKMYKV